MPNISREVIRVNSCCGKEVYKHLKLNEPVPPHVCLSKRNADRELSTHHHHDRKDLCSHGDEESCNNCPDGNGVREGLPKMLSR